MSDILERSLATEARLRKWNLEERGLGDHAAGETKPRHFAPLRLTGGGGGKKKKKPKSSSSMDLMAMFQRQESLLDEVRKLRETTPAARSSRSTSPDTSMRPSCLPPPASVPAVSTSSGSSRAAAPRTLNLPTVPAAAPRTLNLPTVPAAAPSTSKSVLVTLTPAATTTGSSRGGGAWVLPPGAPSPVISIPRLTFASVVASTVPRTPASVTQTAAATTTGTSRGGGAWVLPPPGPPPVISIPRRTFASVVAKSASEAAAVAAAGAAAPAKSDAWLKLSLERVKQVKAVKAKARLERMHELKVTQKGALELKEKRKTEMAALARAKAERTAKANAAKVQSQLNLLYYFKQKAELKAQSAELEREMVELGGSTELTSETSPPPPLLPAASPKRDVRPRAKRGGRVRLQRLDKEGLPSLSPCQEQSSLSESPVATVPRKPDAAVVAEANDEVLSVAAGTSEVSEQHAVVDAIEVPPIASHVLNVDEKPLLSVTGKRVSGLRTGYISGSPGSPLFVPSSSNAGKLVVPARSQFRRKRAPNSSSSESDTETDTDSSGASEFPEVSQTAQTLSARGFEPSVCPVVTGVVIPPPALGTSGTGSKERSNQPVSVSDSSEGEVVKGPRTEVRGKATPDMPTKNRSLGKKRPKVYQTTLETAFNVQHNNDFETFVREQAKLLAREAGARVLVLKHRLTLNIYLCKRTTVQQTFNEPLKGNADLVGKPEKELFGTCVFKACKTVTFRKLPRHYVQCHALNPDDSADFTSASRRYLRLMATNLGPLTDAQLDENKKDIWFDETETADLAAVVPKLLSVQPGEKQILTKLLLAVHSISSIARAPLATAGTELAAKRLETVTDRVLAQEGTSKKQAYADSTLVRVAGVMQRRFEEASNAEHASRDPTSLSSICYSSAELLKATRIGEDKKQYSVLRRKTLQQQSPSHTEGSQVTADEPDFDPSLLKEVAKCPVCVDRLVWRRTIAVHVRKTHSLSGLPARRMCSKMFSSLETVLFKRAVGKGVRMDSSMIDRTISKSMKRRLAADADTDSQLSELDPDKCVDIGSHGKRRIITSKTLVAQAMRAFSKKVFKVKYPKFRKLIAKFDAYMSSQSKGCDDRQSVRVRSRVVSILYLYLRKQKTVDKVKDMDAVTVRQHLWDICSLYVQTQLPNLDANTVQRHLDGMIAFGEFLNVFNSGLPDQETDMRFELSNFKGIVRSAKKLCRGDKSAGNRRQALAERKEESLVSIRIFYAFECSAYVNDILDGAITRLQLMHRVRIGELSEEELEESLSDSWGDVVGVSSAIELRNVITVLMILSLARRSLELTALPMKAFLKPLSVDETGVVLKCYEHKTVATSTAFIKVDKRTFSALTAFVQVYRSQLSSDLNPEGPIFPSYQPCNHKVANRLTMSALGKNFHTTFVRSGVLPKDLVGNMNPRRYRHCVVTTSKRSVLPAGQYKLLAWGMAHSERTALEHYTIGYLKTNSEACAALIAKLKRDSVGGNPPDPVEGRPSGQDPLELYQRTMDLMCIPDNDRFQGETDHLDEPALSQEEYNALPLPSVSSQNLDPLARLERLVDYDLSSDDEGSDLDDGFDDLVEETGESELEEPSDSDGSGGGGGDLLDLPPASSGDALKRKHLVSSTEHDYAKRAKH